MSIGFTQDISGVDNIPSFTFIETLSQGQINDLIALYRNEFWCHNRQRADVETMLAHSDIIIGVVVESKKLVGFARLLTDYVYKATLYDLIVHPDYRSGGLGARLMDRIVNHPKIKNVDHIDLNCLDQMIPFYTKWGFTTEVSDILFMRRIKPVP